MAYVDRLDREASYSNWVSYLARRDFAEYRGTFAGVPSWARGDGDEPRFVVAENASDVCDIHVSCCMYLYVLYSTYDMCVWNLIFFWKMCSAVVVDAATNQMKSRMFSVFYDEDSFQPSDEERTLLSLRSDHVRSEASDVREED